MFCYIVLKIKGQMVQQKERKMIRPELYMKYMGCVSAAPLISYFNDTSVCKAKQTEDNLTCVNLDHEKYEDITTIVS